jgi:hypothetical protein
LRQAFQYWEYSDNNEDKQGSVGFGGMRDKMYQLGVKSAGKYYETALRLVDILARVAEILPPDMRVLAAIG